MSGESNWGEVGGETLWKSKDESVMTLKQAQIKYLRKLNFSSCDMQTKVDYDSHSVIMISLWLQTLSLHFILLHLFNQVSLLATSFISFPHTNFPHTIPEWMNTFQLQWAPSSCFLYHPLCFVLSHLSSLECKSFGAKYSLVIEQWSLSRIYTLTTNIVTLKV